MSAPTDDAVFDDARAPGAGAGVTVPDVARWLAALATLGAGVIHFAFAPEHLSTQTSHGVFFLAVGWGQLLLAAALGFGWRPARGWLLATAGVNGAVAALWLLTRTAGLPGEAVEPVGFPDALATTLEVTAAVVALAVAYGWLADRTVRWPSAAVAGVPAVAVVAVVTASVVPSLGGGHSHGDAHGADGHGHAAATGEAAAPGGHDDHAAGGGTAASSDWSKRRMAALSGYLPDAEVQRLQQVNRDYLSDVLRTRSELLKNLPAAEQKARIDKFVRWSVDNALTGENGANGEDAGMPTMHSHGIEPWQDIEDPAEQAELQAELQTAGTLIAEVPTAADAMKAGYMQVTPYVPGIGAHYLNVRYLLSGGFDPGQPEMLLYNGNVPGSKLIGLSYAVIGKDAPAGFVGPNDSWHVHPSLCIVDGTFVVGPDSTPDDLCASIGGRKGMPFDNPMWMSHLWQVPGWESPWGLFSGENPVVNMASSDVGH